MRTSDKGAWAAIAVFGGICLVTMVLPALFALGGGYLVATGQYVAAALMVVVGLVLLSLRRRGTRGEAGSETETPAQRHELIE